jgi:hypothetical protein
MPVCAEPGGSHVYAPAATVHRTAFRPPGIDAASLGSGRLGFWIFLVRMVGYALIGPADSPASFGGENDHRAFLGYRQSR